ncbi:MAG: homoserine O-succinyltransferase [Lachnospiraceae bacterium]|nr:homoserine O-succinyltransferase [Lachnospiraceae bacterium]MBR4209286.1 homoserine O-succinyltransferase [Lachnospiraceae bacterium]
MPIRVQAGLPAKKILEDENIFVMDENRAITQDIRPLEIVIMNIMPLKEDTELQLLRSLSNTPLQVNVTFLTTGTYRGTHTKSSHLDQFYLTFEDIKDRNFDGMIMTGAPVELMEFEEVDYWPEFCEIMEWSKTHVTSTFHLCWAAQAAFHYHYGLKKYLLPEKRFGIYSHRVKNRRTPLVRGFDDVFYAPHSRHTEILKEDIEKIPGMVILAESEEAGVFLCMLEDGSQIFVLGHPEYDRLSLNNEYRRDIGKGLPIQVPLNYYPNDDPAEKPLLMWRAHASILYSNWLNYYVYQVTPYDITKVHHDGYNTTI